MAKGQYIKKTKNFKNGSQVVVKTGNSITKRDHQEAKSKRKHELDMAKVNNEAYQKEVTKRTNAFAASAAVATPTTTAVANTNAFASGGFDLGTSSGEEETTDSSNSSNNKQEV